MQVEVNPEWSQRLKALADRIAAVEVRIKQAEQISGRVVYPAVGELRYLGRNLARILGDLTGGDINPEAFGTHLRDAELCFTRANNDVIDDDASKVYAHQFELAMQDGILSSRERDMLRLTAKSLGLTRAQAAAIEQKFATS